MSKGRGGGNVIQMDKGPKAVMMTDDLKALDAALVKTFKDAEELNLNLIYNVMKCEEEGAYRAFMFRNMAEYVMDRLGIGNRQAQYLIRTAQAFRRTGLPTETFTEIGATKSREIASFALKAQASKAEVQNLIDECKSNKWTCDRLEQEVRKKLTEKGIITKGIGSDPDEEPLVRAHFMMPSSAKKAIEEHLDTISKRTGTKDPGRNLEMALAEAASSVPDTAPSAYEQAKSFLNSSMAALDTMAGRIGEISGQEQEEMIERVNYLAFSTIVKSGSFIFHDALKRGYLSEDNKPWKPEAAMVVVDIICNLLKALGVKEDQEEELIANIIDSLGIHKEAEEVDIDF